MVPTFLENNKEIQREVCDAFGLSGLSESFVVSRDKIHPPLFGV